MTDIKFSKDNKGNVTQVRIMDTTFYYTNIKSPRPVFDDRKLAYEKARKEYSVEVAVTEDVADAWDEVFAKQPSKKLTNAKFMEKFKLEDESELPFPKEKKQFTIKVNQKAEMKDGSPISDKLLPRVFTVEDGKAQDITFTTNVGNGSKGDMMIRANCNDYGNFAYLSKLKVNSLIEYADGGGVSKDDLDFLGVDDVELDEAPVRKGASVEQEEAKAPVEAAEVDLDDTDF